MMKGEIQTKPNTLFSGKQPPLLLTGMILPATQNGNAGQGFDKQLPIFKDCQKCGNTQGVRQSEMLCPNCALEKALHHLYASQKLSLTGWEQLRLFFKLPKNLKEIPFEQARGISPLLYLFVKTFPLDKQNEISEMEILNWLSKYPSLPKTIAKSIKKRLNRQNQSNSANKTVTSTVNSPNLSSKNKRKAITDKRFSEVAIRQGMFCFWCGVRVVKETRISQSKRINKTAGRIQYYSGDELRDEAMATIDHLIRVIDGGTDEVANLVIACQNCNSERDRVTIRYGRPFARPRVPCPECGGRFFHPDWGCCSICGAPPRNFGHPSKIFEIRQRIAVIWQRLLSFLK